MILGIDPGLASTGYGLVRFDGSRFIHEAHGLIATPSEDPVGQRLLAIYRGMKEVLERFKPDAAGIETLYFAKNVHSAMPVAQARGVVLLSLAEAGVPFCEYTPQQIKQAVVGSGRALKAQLQEVLRIILGLEDAPKPEHSADALAAAVCHINMYGELRRLLLDR